jgi:hypothetical protein
LYLFFAFHGSVRKYSLNSVIAIFIETRWKKKKNLKESLPVIAALFTIMASHFPHDKLHTNIYNREFQSNSTPMKTEKFDRLSQPPTTTIGVWIWQVSSDDVKIVCL